MLLDPLYILETQLGLDDFHVTDGVDLSVDVYDLGIVEGTDHLEDTIDGADMGQEGVAKTSTCRRALQKLLVKVQNQQ